MRLLLILILMWATPASAERLQVLALGDSVLAWHRWTGRDIPSQMGAVLGTQVENAAVAGARFYNGLRVGQSGPADVRGQFQAGPWDIVLLNGGANDLLSQCKCQACDAVLDRLISKDLTGAVPDFVDAVRGSGPQVVWMGYYASYRTGQFAGCRPYLVEYDARISRLAAQRAGLTFVDSEDVIDPKNRSLFALDGIHPSAKGARRIGAFLANALQQ